MGHEFARAAVATAVAFGLVGCGGSGGDADPPPVLQNAREQVAAASADDSSDAESNVSGDVSDDAPLELPAPDPSTFEGANRVVNLWVGIGGDTSAVDVWARRTFTSGPVLLASDIDFAGVSEYFSSPPGHEIVIVGAGAGPDGEERAAVDQASAGEQLTTIFTNNDERGGIAAPSIAERGVGPAPEPPSEGSGVILVAPANLVGFSDRLNEVVGSDVFYLGDGAATCRPQRVEAQGLAPELVGAVPQIEIELPPGPAEISLHPWPSADECAQPPVLALTVDVVAGDTTLVVVYSPNGQSLDALTLPVQTVSG